ncbi:YiaA/YiaB family inner membrane protein [Comamonas sp. MYb21]|uniref:YiaA/YiaB family inner membrane protein n=1 Tax=Comamonas sp. MYb21 TaxID=1848648 RepID=UPI0030B42616
MSPFSNPVQRDTRAWQYQVWISFGIAVSMCTIGLAWLPGQHLEQAFMVMGYMFCLSAAFVLAKFVRDKQADSRQAAGDTPMWRFVVWGGFAIAMGLTGWGLLSMDINPTYKAFLGVSWMYMITTAFTLAKMLRDKHESDLASAIQQARSMRSAPREQDAGHPQERV